MQFMLCLCIGSAGGHVFLYFAEFVTPLVWSLQSEFK
jgi:hypothetical protein